MFSNINELKKRLSANKEVVFTEKKVKIFSEIVDDYAPVHCNLEFANKKGFEKRIVHGLFIHSQFSGILGQELPGPNSIINSITGKFHKPVFIDDVIEFIVEVKQVVPAVNAVVLVLSAFNKDKVQVFSGNATCSFPEKV